MVVSRLQISSRYWSKWNVFVLLPNERIHSGLMVFYGILENVDDSWDTELAWYPQNVICLHDGITVFPSLTCVNTPLGHSPVAYVLGVVTVCKTCYTMCEMCWNVCVINYSILGYRHERICHGVYSDGHFPLVIQIKYGSSYYFTYTSLGTNPESVMKFRTRMVGSRNPYW